MNNVQVENDALEKTSIDDVQTATVDEHYQVLLADEKLIDSEIVNVTQDDLPDWYDDRLFKAGQKYYQRNLAAMSSATLSGLVAVLTIPSILKVLMWTKHSSTPCAAFKRYLENILHIYVFYVNDSKDDNSKWYKSLASVRAQHCISSRRSHFAGTGGIMHRDMAITQFCFIGYALCNAQNLGLTNGSEEREGFNHFWRVLGHMLGISDRLNICRKTAAETTELCEKLKEIFGKYFEEVPPNFMDMTVAMLDGMRCIDVTINIDAVLTLTYSLHNLKYPKTLGWWSWIVLNYHLLVRFLLGKPYVGTLVRNVFNFNLRLNYWILERWPVIAWIRFGKEKSRINLYPKLKSI